MNDEEKKQFIINDRVTVEGITEDYVWYNSERLRIQMDSWQHDFNKLVSVMEARHKEHLKIIDDLLKEINRLNNRLKKEKADE